MASSSQAPLDHWTIAVNPRHRSSDGGATWAMTSASVGSVAGEVPTDSAAPEPRAAPAGRRAVGTESGSLPGERQRPRLIGDEEAVERGPHPGRRHPAGHPHLVLDATRVELELVG